MHYLVIDLNAKRTGETLITLETGDGTMITDKLFSNLIEPKGGNAWLDPLGDFAKCLSNQLISLSYQFNFFVSLQKYHSVIINKQLPTLCDL